MARPSRRRHTGAVQGETIETGRNDSHWNRSGIPRSQTPILSRIVGAIGAEAVRLPRGNDLGRRRPPLPQLCLRPARERELPSAIVNESLD